MPEFKVHDGAAWRRAQQLHFNDGTFWRKAKEVWVRGADGWIKAFAGLFANFYPITGSAYGQASEMQDPGRSELVVRADGTWSLMESDFNSNWSEAAGGNWGGPTNAGGGAAYEMLTEHVSGRNIFGHNYWMSLGSDVSKSITGDNFRAGHISTTFLIKIRLAGSATNLIESSVSLAAQCVEPGQIPI